MTEFGGKVSSLLTNYDITFWLLLCSALDSTTPTEIERRACTALPFHKVPVRPLQPQVARTMASLNLLLVQSKAEDDAADGERFKAGIARTLYSKRFAKAQAYLAEGDFPIESITGLPEAQSAAESAPSPSLATLGAPTSHTLGEIFAFIGPLLEKPELGNVLRKFGTELGGYLYLWDAFQDRESDERRGSFNALLTTQTSNSTLRDCLHDKLSNMRCLLHSMALGPEGALVFGLLRSLETRLLSELPAPQPASTHNPGRRLAKAGMVRTQECCELDCCQCGSCCDCNVCDCNGPDHDTCVELNLCDMIGVCLCCCDDSGSSRRRSSTCCVDDCRDARCFESLCCSGGDTHYVHVDNHSYTPDNSKKEKPGLFRKLKSMTGGGPQAREGGSGKRQCPKCATSMINLMVGDTQIEECRNCGGLWLDDKELDILARFPRLPHNLLNRYPSDEQPPRNLVGERPCPACESEEALVVVPYLDIPVEMCRKCHGFWLEHGVLRNVLKAKRSPKRLLKDHRKEWRCPYCEMVSEAGSDVCSNCGAPRPKSGFTGKLA